MTEIHELICTRRRRWFTDLPEAVAAADRVEGPAWVRTHHPPRCLACAFGVATTPDGLCVECRTNANVYGWGS